MSVTVNLQCFKHKSYQAKRWPRSKCRTCLYIFYFVQDGYTHSTDTAVADNMLIQRAS